jgi:hypothetical protein
LRAFHLLRNPTVGIESLLAGVIKIGRQLLGTLPCDARDKNLLIKAVPINKPVYSGPLVILMSIQDRLRSGDVISH